MQLLMSPFSHEAIKFEARIKRAVRRGSNSKLVDSQVQAELEKRLTQVGKVEVYSACSLQHTLTMM
jgi:hypothetical protein